MRIAEYALPVTALVALAACNGNAGEQSGGDVAETSSSVTEDVAEEADEVADAEADPIIPAAFHGEWDMKASDSCTASDKRIIITGNSISSWGSEPQEIIKATLVGEGDLQLVGAVDPEHPDEDQSIGLYLSDGGNAIAMGAPNMTGMNLVRCQKGKRALASSVAAATSQSEKGRLPKAMLGSWDKPGPNACSKASDDLIKVAADRLIFARGYSKISQIERLADGEYLMMGQYVEGGEERFIPNSMKLTLDADGRRLTMMVEGFDDEVFDVRCNGVAR
tara:strand:+ start:141 stop:974 length:834 start_codon:yes stop_codon:yes gene_type:complete